MISACIGFLFSEGIFTFLASWGARIGVAAAGAHYLGKAINWFHHLF